MDDILATRIKGLHSKKDRALDELREMINRADAEKRDLTGGEIARFEATSAQLEDLDNEIGTLTDISERSSVMGESRSRLGLGGGDSDTESRSRWLPTLREYRELSEGRAISTSGNPFIPVGQAATWYDHLRARSVVLSANPNILTMDEGTLRVPKLATSVSVSAVGEAVAIPESTPTFADVTLEAVKVAAFTLASSESLDDSRPALLQVVQQDMIKQTATFLDQQFLTGSGSGANMRGLLATPGITEIQVSGVNGGNAGFDDLADALGALEGAGGDTSRAVWFLSPRTYASLRKIKDSSGRYLLNYSPDGTTPATIFGIPVSTTSNLPINGTYGTSSDASNVILADMSQVVIGRRKDVEVAVSTDFAFKNDQVAIRVIGRFDIGVINPEAVVVLKGVRN